MAQVEVARRDFGRAGGNGVAAVANLANDARERERHRLHGRHQAVCVAGLQWHVHIQVAVGDPARHAARVVGLAAELARDRAREQNRTRHARQHGEQHRGDAPLDGTLLVGLGVHDGRSCLLCDLGAGLAQRDGGVAVNPVHRLVAHRDVEARILELLDGLAIRLPHRLVQRDEVFHLRARLAGLHVDRELLRSGLHGLLVLPEAAPVLVELRRVLAAEQDVLAVLNLILERDQGVGRLTRLRVVDLDEPLVGAGRTVHLQHAKEPCRGRGQERPADGKRELVNQFHSSPSH